MLRPIAAATVLAVTILVASDVPTLGAELPPPLGVAPSPALGAVAAVPDTPQIPSLPPLPLPSTPLQPSTPTALQSTPPPAPAAPAQGSSSQSRPAQAAASTQRGASSTDFQRRSGSDSSSGVQSGQATGRSRGSARAARTSRGRRRATRPDRSALSFRTVEFDRLGELLGPRPPASQILGDFPASPTGDATWAPPLLAIMLLIGLGGFARVGLTARRRS